MLAEEPAKPAIASRHSSCRVRLGLGEELIGRERLAVLDGVGTRHGRQGEGHEGQESQRLHGDLLDGCLFAEPRPGLSGTRYGRVRPSPVSFDAAATPGR